MNIDEICDDPKLMQKAIGGLHWQNAVLKSYFIGSSNHGILTIQLDFEGDGWAQCFGGHNLSHGTTFQKFIKACLEFTSLESRSPSRERHLRVGRLGGEYGQIIAIRPFIEADPVFWPGAQLDERSYLFDGDGVMKA